MLRWFQLKRKKNFISLRSLMSSSWAVDFCFLQNSSLGPFVASVVWQLPHDTLASILIWRNSFSVALKRFRECCGCWRHCRISMGVPKLVCMCISKRNDIDKMRILLVSEENCTWFDLSVQWLHFYVITLKNSDKTYVWYDIQQWPGNTDTLGNSPANAN